ncbi:MAG TPA: STAS domain-containing protein [Gemmataceae bacterium]|nr:STAS domain-containing protein [Gemmataceae bacterium]
MQRVQNITLLQLSDEVLTAQSLGIVHRRLEEPGAPVIHLDLGGVRCPTADGLGALAVLNKELRARGGALVLNNVATAVYEVFCLTHLIDVLEVRTISPSCRQKNQRAGGAPGSIRERQASSTEG